MTNPKETRILGLSPEYEALMKTHQTNLEKLAADYGLKIKTMGFAVTFDKSVQDSAAYQGCTCFACAAETQILLHKGIVHAIQSVTPDQTTARIH